MRRDGEREEMVRRGEQCEGVSGDMSEVSISDGMGSGLQNASRKNLSGFSDLEGQTILRDHYLLNLRQSILGEQPRSPILHFHLLILLVDVQRTRQPSQQRVVVVPSAPVPLLFFLLSFPFFLLLGIVVEQTADGGLGGVDSMLNGGLGIGLAIGGYEIVQVATQLASHVEYQLSQLFEIILETT